MSVVTDTILLYGLGDGEDFGRLLVARVNEFFGEYRGFVHVEEGSWHGGTMALQCNVAIGAFNYLHLDELREHLRVIDWAAEGVSWVQLCYQLEQEEGFRLEEIFREDPRTRPQEDKT